MFFLNNHIRSPLHLSIVINDVYFSGFDPISVLASLAFLAFLLQSFATLFDRSRSILPTIVSGRKSAVDLRVPDISKHVLHALREYVSVPKLNDSWVTNNKNIMNVVLSGKSQWRLGEKIIPRLFTCVDLCCFSIPTSDLWEFSWIIYSFLKDTYN